MAEYYPLLARAVAGMRNAPPEKRRDIYDRARQALLGQLRSMQPPVPEESITREATALDEAIARVEAEITAVKQEAKPAESSPPPQPPTPEPAPTAAPGSQPAAIEVPPPPPPPAAIAEPARAPAQPAPPPPPIERPAVEPAPMAPIPPKLAPTPVVPPRAPGSRPAAEALGRIVAERAPAAPVIRATGPEDLGSAPGKPTGPVLPSAPRLEVPSFADAMAAAGTGDAAAEDGTEPLEEAVAPPRNETARPLAPRPVTKERFNPRVLIMALVASVVVAGIAYAAWRLRDRPEALERSREAQIAAQQAEQQNNKVSTRVTPAGGDAKGATATQPRATAGQAAPSAPAPAPATPAPQPATEAPAQKAANDSAPQTTPPASAPSVVPAPAASSPNPPVTTGAPAAATATTDTNPVLPVAQRAALLVDAPEDPQKVKTYVGTVVWSAENASTGQGQPISRTVHADIDIPDAGLKLAMVFQKNDEAQFPASHTIELRFTLGPNNTLGPIKQINVPQMRKDDTPAGDTLVGLPVTITDNYFLVGLSRGDATARNLDLIKTRNWFDIPILLASGKIAKVTFEKGTPGQKAIDEVVQSWQ